MDKISIIIPCYNVEKYIDRCLSSLDDQTYVHNGIGDMELILIDDASTDNTRAKLLLYEAKNPERVIVVSCDTNSGPACARNIAMKYASGDYISFVDADDMADPTMLERMTWWNALT